MLVETRLETILTTIGCTDIVYKDFKFLQDQELIIQLHFTYQKCLIKINMYFKENNFGININTIELTKKDIQTIINEIKINKELLINDFEELTKI